MKRNPQCLLAMLLVIVLIAALAVVLVACGDNNDNGGADPSAHEHNYNLVAAEEPTCTQGGNEEYYVCDECNSYFNSQKQLIQAIPTLPAKGHDKVMTKWKTDGTSHWHKCNNCNEKLDLASHTLDGWIDDVEATCLHKATHHKECPICDYHTTPEEYGDFGEHIYSRTDAEEPTCTQSGNEEYYTCDICDKYFDSRFQQIADVPTISPRGHEKVTDRWETDGVSHWRKCNNCDEQLDLDSHEFGDWINDGVEATCLRKATHHKECPICNYHTASEDYGAYGAHSYNLTSAQEPTCTQGGNDEYYTCDVCNSYFDSQFQQIGTIPTLPANGHSKVMDSWETDGDSHWHTCLNCEEKFDFDSHQFNWIEDDEATCEQLATHHQKCSTCYYETNPIEYGELAAHKYSKTDAKTPTCTEDGNDEYYTCDVCSKYFDSQYKQIDEIPTLPASHDKVTDRWETDDASHWHKCNNCYEQLDIDEHKFGEWTIDNAEYMCGDIVTRHRECPTCGYFQTEEDYIVPHIWNSDTNKCDKCGESKPYIEAGEENLWSMLYFGEYPQTKVTEDGSGLIATLTQKSGDRPVKGNRGKWTDYEYFISNKVDEYMWYIDIEEAGAKYRGVYFTSYRPDVMTSGGGINYQSKNGYEINNLYWFKWEPIKWRILESTDGEALLLSDVILDSQQYTNNSYDAKIRSNYKESYIRAWLNEEFYNWAFDKLDKSIIKKTLVDNSAATTNNPGWNPNTCENTLDNVFLLSYSEANNYKLNYMPTTSGFLYRQLKPTEYAKAQGASSSAASTFLGMGSWWLRSPDSNWNYPSYVMANGELYNDKRISGVEGTHTEFGVVPALWITL